MVSRRFSPVLLLGGQRSYMCWEVKRSSQSSEDTTPVRRPTLGDQPRRPALMMTILPRNWLVTTMHHYYNLSCIA